MTTRLELEALTYQRRQAEALERIATVAEWFKQYQRGDVISYDVIITGTEETTNG